MRSGQEYEPLQISYILTEKKLLSYCKLFKVTYGV